MQAILRAKLSVFTQKVFNTVSPDTEYLHNWHIDAISEYLLAVTRGDIKRLIINIPPRFMKSISVSVAWPAWLLGHNPSEQIICSSFDRRLAIKHSLDTRLVLESEWYRDLFPDTILTHDQNQQQKFQTTARGHRIACSVGSGITGEGGNFLIVDDPHNPLEMDSEVQRDRAITWFRQIFLSRLNDKQTGKVVVIMQRLGLEDLSGTLLEEGGWEHLCLPVKNDEQRTIHIGTLKKELGPGELLHKKRIDEETIANIRHEVGEQVFAGQYLQRPMPDGGGLFKAAYLKYYHRPLLKEEARAFFGGMNIYILVDPAHTEKKTSDYSAFMVVGANYDRNLYLIDIVRDRLNPSERIDILFKLHRKWLTISGNPPKVGYETNGAKSDAHYINDRMRTERYYINLIEVNHSRKKNDRIGGLESYFRHGRILFPDEGVMYKDKLGKTNNLLDIMINKEMLPFPHGIHPDMLDAMAQVLDEEMGLFYPGAPESAACILPGSDYNPIVTRQTVEERSWMDL